MAESANSSAVTVTPEFVANKFQQPSWHVEVNGIPMSNAILDRVDIGFGSDLSSAIFTLPINPLTAISPPVENDLVEIIVNSKTIFKGLIKIKTDHIGSDGLKITYTALSKIVTLNENVVLYGSFNSTNSDFPFFLYNVTPIFSILGISASNVPNAYPGEVDVTDQTLLSAAETLLNKVGNYKLHYDMVNDSLDVYTLQTGGTNVRSFIPGKNIIKYDVHKSSENVVDEVIILGPRQQLTFQNPVTFLNTAVAPNGRSELYFTLSGRNIRILSVEGLTREQPVIEYSSSFPVSKKMLLNSQPSFDIAPGEFLSLDSNVNNGIGNTDTDDSTKLYPKIISQAPYQAQWTQVGISTVYNGTESVTVFLSEVPKQWQSHTIKGTVQNSSIGLQPSDGTTDVEILDEMIWTPAPVRVTYTIDGDKPAVTQGSGTIKRSISDSQYQIIINTVTGENNSAFILSEMALRANAEYQRLHYPIISGTISVVGDESIDLKQTILLEGLYLDILHITHNFSNGFTTDVTITNERLRTNIILRPPFQRPINDTEKDKRRNLLIENQNADLLRKQNQQSHSEKKDSVAAPSLGNYAVLHD